MRVENVTTTQFSASFRSPVDVFKRSENTFQSIGASFVELNPFSTNDMKALNDITTYWKYDKFALKIAAEAKTKRQNPHKNSNNRFYAVTLQDGNYGELNSDLILGVVQVAELDKPKNILLEYIQTNPKYLYSIDKQIKGIGFAMIRSLKELYDTITLNSINDHYVRNFYKRNKFREFSQNWYRWSITG